jgi:hypothetical protein
VRPLNQEALGDGSQDRILALLKAYNGEMTDENYVNLRNTLGVFI